MSDEKDYTLDGKDRAEWDRLWSAKTQRRLPGPCMLDLPRECKSEALKQVTIFDDPPEAAGLVFRSSDTCPICGAPTAGCDRVAASLDLTFASGLTFGMGVWAHRLCFERCADTGIPAPIPW